AGTAEAVIGAVLLLGALALVRKRRNAAIAATAFAIVGFLVGLSFTLRGGDGVDVAYHATMLPILLLTLLALLRQPRPARPAGARRIASAATTSRRTIPVHGPVLGAKET